MIVISHPERDIPPMEFFDNRTQEFITIPAKHLEKMNLQLEHSLMSVAKWEGIWHESFTGQKQINGEKLLSYIRCMTVNPQKNPAVYEQLVNEDLAKIVGYMQDPKSAWEIRPQKPGPKKNRKPQTAEEIYWAMVQYGLPWDCEKWHFNRLLALLDYFDYKGGSNPGYGGQKKKSEREIMEIYRAMNEKNRKKYNSKG